MSQQPAQLLKDRSRRHYCQEISKRSASLKKAEKLPLKDTLPTNRKETTMALAKVKKVKYRIGNKSPLTQTGMQVRYGNTEACLIRTLMEKHNNPNERIELIEVVWE